VGCATLLEKGLLAAREEYEFNMPDDEESPD
jgi:hypothetical protein